MKDPDQDFLDTLAQLEAKSGAMAVNGNVWKQSNPEKDTESTEDDKQAQKVIDSAQQ